VFSDFKELRIYFEQRLAGLNAPRGILCFLTDYTGVEADFEEEECLNAPRGILCFLT